jgi:glycosyltransferase involved in cell wall biosynthesis
MGERVDIIYTNTIVVSSGAIAAKIARKAHIWHVHEIIEGNPNLRFFYSNDTLFRIINSLSDFIIANSTATASQFKCVTKINKIKVIHYGIEHGGHNMLSTLPAIDGIHKTDWIVAVVGRVQVRKGHDIAIRALSIARREIANIKLLIIGSSDVLYANYLGQLSTDLNVVDRVIFTGRRDDIWRILPHCKALLVTSVSEGFGFTIIEAMSAGIPVIATKCGGPVDIIDDGITGYLVELGNYKEMAQKIIRLYRQPSLVSSFVEKGKDVVKENFPPEKYARAIEKVIQETRLEQ